MTLDTFYEDNLIHMERAKLATDIDIEVNNLYPIKANFYIPILTPTLNLDNPYEKIITPSKNQKNIHGDTLLTESYTESNYIELEIPIYVQQQYICQNNNVNTQLTNIKSCIGAYLDEPFDIDIIKNIFSNIYCILDENDRENSIITIPKDTEFIITSIGNEIKYEYIRIIGIFTPHSEEE